MFNSLKRVKETKLKIESECSYKNNELVNRLVSENEATSLLVAKMIHENEKLISDNEKLVNKLVSENEEMKKTYNSILEKIVSDNSSNNESNSSIVKHLCELVTPPKKNDKKWYNF